MLHSFKWFKIFLQFNQMICIILCVHTVWISNSSLQPIDRILSDATILGNSEPGSNGNERVLLISQSSSAGASPSYGLKSYRDTRRQGLTRLGWDGYCHIRDTRCGGLTPLQRCSRCNSTAPAVWRSSRNRQAKKRPCVYCGTGSQFTTSSKSYDLFVLLWKQINLKHKFTERSRIDWLILTAC